MYIYLYTSGPPLFPPPPGVLPLPKTGTAVESTTRPAPGNIGPAPALILFGIWTKRSCPPKTYKPAEPRPQTRILPYDEQRIIDIKRHSPRICPHITDYLLYTTIPAICQADADNSSGSAAFQAVERPQITDNCLSSKDTTTPPVYTSRPL